MKKPPRCAAAFLALALNSPAIFAYGSGGGSSSSCSEPKFYDQSPAKNATVSSLSEISLIASDDTDISTLELEVNGNRLQPDISQRRSGDWLLHAKLAEPITQSGKVRVTLVAKSKDGCSTFYPYYLDVRQ
jgi:hypothetical protein